ncbi:DsrE family protein [Halobaculum magnesiiphilum]|uniref:DsrE family protein n=1 Tax=Halobaculum magnesiiphilum TaxID=1017351 RepID=A0A8T8WHJ6_9EURY|nr:DsrE family protein [Halobaculum magnesiiphilum]QZP39329.1 DsrE family protein [Halobaculum magnesiiphilum]
MKTVFHVSDGADDIQDAAIRYSGGIFEDDSVDIDAVAVVANASGIGLVQSDSTYAEEIRSLSEGDVRFIACEKSMEAAGLTVDDILDVVDTAPTSVGALTRLQDEGYRYIKVP